MDGDHGVENKYTGGCGVAVSHVASLARSEEEHFFFDPNDPVRSYSLPRLLFLVT